MQDLFMMAMDDLVMMTDGLDTCYKKVFNAGQTRHLSWVESSCKEHFLKLSFIEGSV